MPGLTISVLGPLSITLDGRPVEALRIRPAIALCVYLACQPEIHRRERLMELFWPEGSQTSAQQNLRQTVYTLRRALPEVTGRRDAMPVPFILAGRETLQVNAEAAVAVDCHQFTWLLSQATPDALVEAVALYRGDFLADFYIPDSNPFEEWAAARREVYRRLALGALERLADMALAKPDHVAAEGYARRQLEIDNLRESAHRQLLLALAHSGQRAAALAHFEAYYQLLDSELGVEPSADVRALSERIARGDEAPAVPRVSPTNRVGQRVNLPAQLTPFLGREHEVTEVVDLLREPAARLVTLTGVGGTGKTRLALEAAARAAIHFPDGVDFVALEVVRDPAQLTTKLLRVLEVRERIGDTALDTLKNYLRDRRQLLVLDNFEQIVEGAPLISELLRAAPFVKALVTSREELRIYGEHLYPVPPMSLPREDARTAGALAGIESVQLFIQRAAGVRREFKLNDENAEDVAAICRGLDGLPLALELAAAQLRRFSPAQLRERLGSRLSLLASDFRDVTTRQRTLRGTIDWSYNLLPAEEQALFARLGIFNGGWTLDAAEAIVAGESVADVYDGLERLADKNLVYAREAGQGLRRYGMLETIREYAVERLQDRGEYDRLAERHLRYFFDLRQAIQGTNPEQLQALWRVEQPNYLAAMEWGSDRPDVSMAVRLASTTSFVWETYGWYREALDLALRFRSLPGVIEPAWIATAIRSQAAGKAIFLHEYELARELLLETLALDRAGNNIEDEVHTLLMLGRVDIEAGRYAAGVEICQQALRLAKENGVLQDFIVAWTTEGQLALGRLDEAAETLAPVINSTRIPDDTGLVWPRLVEYELLRGDHDKALEALRRGHEFVRPRVRIWRNFLVGVTGWLLERPDSPTTDVRTATRLLAANDALAARSGDTLSAFYRELVERRVALARGRLGAEEFRIAWDEGQDWSEVVADRAISRILERQQPARR